MFGIGMPEMILILAVALIVIGPKKLPDLAKSLGRAFGEFKKATSDLKDSLDVDTGFSEVTKTFDDATEDIKSTVDESTDETETAQTDATPAADEKTDEGSRLDDLLWREGGVRKRPARHQCDAPGDARRVVGGHRDAGRTPRLDDPCRVAAGGT